MSTDEPSERLARVLEAVPDHDEGAVTTDQLCSAAGFGDAGPAAEVVAGFLRLSGAVVLTEDPATGRHTVKAASPAAALFLKSLAAYVRSGTPVLDNWARAGTTEPPYQPQQVLAGAQFLYVIEHRRLSLDPQASPLRSGRVVQVLIKTRLRLLGPRYLMIYDRAARQYQLPGGHVRSDDLDPLATAVRELEEELPGFTFDLRRDRLVELGEVEVVQQSRTYGAVTRYRMHFVQLTSTRRELKAGPDGQWVTERALLEEGRLVEGSGVNTTGLRRLVAGLPGGLGRLAPGLVLGRRPSTTVLIREKPWEVLGAVLSVAGIVVAIVQLVAEWGVG
ncbi:NUDIX hydrolase [Verrucosispora sp. WMMD573]|uniref:NUDIX hydrolase n=1 Tax=Verrucosispora sp. WMMD573 TaxID=3015149 RepID=UPI00248CF626|nr:NUDIX hydrolase [Verrucosispora sp. WMMD573]WBB53360.1 NUDIX hydrolase [Verrucosispora sp. WMMD573]